VRSPSGVKILLALLTDNAIKTLTSEGDLTEIHAINERGIQKKKNPTNGPFLNIIIRN
jgi:hypothetical protein